MLVEKLSNQSRQVIFIAKKKAERETLGLPTFAHLLSSLSSQKDDLISKVWPSVNLKIERSALYQTAPLEEILKEAALEARRNSSETVEPSHLLVSTLKMLKVGEAEINEVRKKLWFEGRMIVDSKGRKTMLESYTKDLSLESEAVFIRSEIHEAVKILLRRDKGSLCLSGERGVGKTSLVKAMSRIFTFPTLSSLKHSSFTQLKLSDKMLAKPLKILQFDTNAFLLDDLQSPEDAFGNILTEASKLEEVILFFDDFNLFFTPSITFHAVIPTLKSFLETSRLRVIVAYNTSEFSKVFEQDDFFTRYFTTLNLGEVGSEDALEILKVRKENFESYHGVGVEESILPEVVRLSDYIQNSFLPEKAIDLLDLSCVEARVNGAIQGGSATLTLSEVCEVASRLSGIPLRTLESRERLSLINLEGILGSEIIGQEEAVRTLSKALRRSRLGLQEPTKPSASFLFLGPTGVGKTELVRVLASRLFGKDANGLSRLIKIDMSEFRERHTVSRLIGAPPGYVGYGQGGELTEKVLRNPYSVILADEMEKASSEVLNIFLQILDDGVLTDGEGNTVDFRHTIVIFTSNVGADLIKKGRMGFELDSKGGPSSKKRSGEDSSFSEMKDKLLGELKKSFRPEFLNRLDSIIVFRKLTKEDVKKISRLRLRAVAERFKEKGIVLSFDQPTVDYISKIGFSDEYGARFLKRTIEEKVTDPLAGFILNSRLLGGDKVKISASRRGLHFNIFRSRKSISQALVKNR